MLYLIIVITYRLFHHRNTNNTNTISGVFPPYHVSWVRQQIKDERLGWGRYSQLYRQDYLVDTLNDDAALQDAAKVEVDKQHSSKMGSTWQKVHLGKKKRKAITAEENKEIEADRLARVNFAKLD